MSLLTEGYWPDTYWVEDYWQTSNQYWPEYGAVAVEVDDELIRMVNWYLLEEAKTWL